MPRANGGRLFSTVSQSYAVIFLGCAFFFVLMRSDTSASQQTSAVSTHLVLSALRALALAAIARHWEYAVARHSAILSSDEFVDILPSDQIEETSSWGAPVNPS